MEKRKALVPREVWDKRLRVWFGDGEGSEITGIVDYKGPFGVDWAKDRNLKGPELHAYALSLTDARGNDGGDEVYPYCYVLLSPNDPEGVEKQLWENVDVGELIGFRVKGQEIVLAKSPKRP
jgi:hypothetical protein